MSYGAGDSEKGWRHLVQIAVGLALWSLPAIVFAAEGHHEVEMEGGFTLAMRALNFFLLVGLLYYLLHKPIRNFLNQRQNAARESLEEAKRSREEAEARYREMERKLAAAQGEMAELRKMLVEQGQVEKERILANAQKESAKIRKQAEITSEQELRKAQYALRQEAVELAARMAEAILKERIEPKDHDRLIKDYVETVGKSA
jgi:F-type H+-transporting ATPase subunit b